MEKLAATEVWVHLALPSGHRTGSWSQLSTQKACLDFDYSHCPVRWFWLTSILVPFGLICQPSHITPPYAILLQLSIWRHSISLKHWLTSTNVCGVRTSQTMHLIFTTIENVKSHCICSGYWFLSCLAYCKFLILICMSILYLWTTWIKLYIENIPK